MGANRNTFMVYGKYDPTFLPELTHEMLGALRKSGAEPRTWSFQWALFAGAGSVQLHCWLADVHLFSGSISVRLACQMVFAELESTMVEVMVPR